MNVDTGHLVKLCVGGGMPDLNMMKDLIQVVNEKNESLQKVKEVDYIPVPPELDRAAKLKLAGRNEAYVSLTSGGKLSKWAAKERKKRRKMAQESRRRNRG